MEYKEHYTVGRRGRRVGEVTELYKIIPAKVLPSCKVFSVYQKLTKARLMNNINCVKIIIK